MREETFAKWLAPNSVTVVITQQTILQHGEQVPNGQLYQNSLYITELKPSWVHLKHILNYKLVYIQ